MLLDMATGRSTDNIVSLAGQELLTTSVLDGSAGQLPILLEEFDAIAAIVAEDPRWVAALAARGMTAASCPQAEPSVRHRFGQPFLTTQFALYSL